MFKSVGKRIEKIKKELEKQNNKSEELRVVFNCFIEECFPEGKAFNFDLDYDNRKIKIKTSNKVIANELFLRINNFSRLLKEKNIEADQIVII